MRLSYAVIFLVQASIHARGVGLHPRDSVRVELDWLQHERKHRLNTSRPADAFV